MSILKNNQLNTWLLAKSALWVTPDTMVTPVLKARFTDVLTPAGAKTVTLGVEDETEAHFRVYVTLDAAEDLPNGVITLSAETHYEVDYFAEADGPDPPPAERFWHDLIRVVD